MSIQPVPPSSSPTTAGQLAARATQNDQALAAWLGDVEDRVAALESGSGTSGSGILNVSGTVDLDDVAGIREVYATASATVEGVTLTAGDAAVFRYLAGAWTYMVVGEHTTWQVAPPTPGADTTPPNPGSLAVTGSGDAGTTRTLTVTGASDAGGLHATPYRFSNNGGTTWSAYQSSNVFTTAALAAGTYQPRVMVRDAAGNTATASAADFTLTAGLPVVEYLQTAWSTTAGATQTFAAQNLGPATATRTIVAVLVGVRSAVDTVLSSATIGGVAATIVRQGDPHELIAIISANVPTGTSGDVVLTANKSLVGSGVALYSIPNGVGAAHATDLKSGATTGEPADNVLDVPANGALIAGFYGRAGGTGLPAPNTDWVTFPEDSAAAAVIGTNTRALETGHKEFATAQTGYTIDIYSPTLSHQMKIAASWPVNP